MSAMRFNARLDKSLHGPLHPFEDAGVDAASLIMTANTSVQKSTLTAQCIIDTSSSSTLTCGQRLVMISWHDCVLRHIALKATSTETFSHKICQSH
jgi:hypothetical protein